MTHKCKGYSGWIDDHFTLKKVSSPVILAANVRNLWNIIKKKPQSFSGATTQNFLKGENVSNLLDPSEDFTTLLKSICFFFQEELDYSWFLPSLINHKKKKSNYDFFCPHNRNVCKQKCVTFLLTVTIFKCIFCVHIKIFFYYNFLLWNTNPTTMQCTFQGIF